MKWKDDPPGPMDVVWLLMVVTTIAVFLGYCWGAA